MWCIEIVNDVLKLDLAELRRLKIIWPGVMKRSCGILRIGRRHYYIATCLVEMIWVDNYWLDIHSTQVHLLGLHCELLIVSSCKLVVLVLNGGPLKMGAFNCSFWWAQRRGWLGKRASDKLLLRHMIWNAASKPLLFLLIAGGDLTMVI